jgi:hypothetical protein
MVGPWINGMPMGTSGWNSKETNKFLKIVLIFQA